MNKDKLIKLWVFLKKKKKTITNFLNPLNIYQPHHMRFVRVRRVFFFLYIYILKKKKKEIGVVVEGEIDASKQNVRKPS